VLGAFALYTDVNPEEEAIRVAVSPILIGLVLVVIVAFLFFLARGIIQMRRYGSPTDPMLALVGASGRAQTLIAPTGIAYAGGESWSARSRGAQLAPGTPVRVVGVEGLELIVEPAATPEVPTREDPSVVLR
jgi:membrane-bound ClpP family serine protease